MRALPWIVLEALLALVLQALAWFSGGCMIVLGIVYFKTGDLLIPRHQVLFTAVAAVVCQVCVFHAVQTLSNEWAVWRLSKKTKEPSE